MIDFTLPLKEPFRLWQSFWIILGLWMLNYLFHIVLYEWRYGIGGGDYFIDHGKKETINHYKKGSNGNIGIKK